MNTNDCTRCGHDIHTHPTVLDPKGTSCVVAGCPCPLFDQRDDPPPFTSSELLAAKDATIADLRARLDEEKACHELAVKVTLNLGRKLEAAESRIAALEAALRPFAEYVPVESLPENEVFVVVWTGSAEWAGIDSKIVNAWGGVTAGDLRLAAAAIQAKEGA